MALVPDTLPSGSDDTSQIGALLKKAGGWMVVVLVVVFFYPILFQGKVFFYYDFTYYTYPTRYFLHTVLRQGEIPFWIHAIQTGDPIMQSLLAEVLYPPSLLFLLPDFPSAINLFYTLHFLLLGGFVWKLARLWGCSLEGSLAGAATAMLGGFALSAVLTNNYFMANCWFPFVLYCAERYWRDVQGRWFLGATLGLACMTLAGSPSSCLFTVLTLAAYALVRRKTIASQPRSVMFMGVTLAAIVIFCLGMAAMQLLPTYNLVPLSIRKGGLPFDHHSAYSLTWSMASEMLLTRNLYGFLSKSPEIFENSSRLLQSVYMGLLPIIGLFAAFQWRSLDIVRKFWLGVFAVGFFCALGSSNPLYEILFNVVPGVDRFRYPEKYMFLVAYALSFIVAFTVDALSDRIRSGFFRPKLFWAGWGVVLVSIIGISFWKEYRLPGPPIVLLLVLAGLWVLANREKLSPSGFRKSLLVLVVFDLFVHNSPLPPIVDVNFYQTPSAIAQDLLSRPEPRRLHAGIVSDEYRSFPSPLAPTLFSRQISGMELSLAFSGLLYGLEYAHGVQGIGMEMEDMSLRHKIYGKSSKERRLLILRRLGVNYWIDVDTPLKFAKGPTSYVPLILPDRLHTLDNPLPRAFLVGKTRLGESFKLLNTYFDKEFDPLKEVLVDKDVDLKPDPNFEGTVESIQYSPNRVQVKTRQNGEGILVLLDRYFPGWSVTVDGVPAEIFRANHLFRGVRLGPGPHTLEFSFIPQGFETGLSVSVASLLITVGIALAHRRRRSSTANNTISN